MRGMGAHQFGDPLVVEGIAFPDSGIDRTGMIVNLDTEHTLKFERIADREEGPLRVIEDTEKVLCASLANGCVDACNQIVSFLFEYGQSGESVRGFDCDRLFESGLGRSGNHSDMDKRIPKPRRIPLECGHIVFERIQCEERIVRERGLIDEISMIGERDDGNAEGTV